MIRRRMARWLRNIADRVDRQGAPKAIGMWFTFEDGKGIEFRDDGRGCRLWYIGDDDYERAHTQAGPVDLTRSTKNHHTELGSLLNDCARLYLTALDGRRAATQERDRERWEHQQEVEELRRDLRHATERRDSWRRLALLGARRAKRLAGGHR